MPERQGHTETLRAGIPVAVSTVTPLPIERIVMHSDKGATGVWFAIAKALRCGINELFKN